MSNASLYKVKGKGRRMMTAYLRNQMEYLMQAMKMLDVKAKIIIRINALIIGGVLSLQTLFEDFFFRFKPLIILVLITAVISMALAILVIRPHVQLLKRFYKKYIEPFYSDISFSSVMAIVSTGLQQREETFDLMVKDDAVTLGHISRVNYVFQYYHGMKYLLLDWAFRIFMLTIILMAPIFLVTSYKAYTKIDSDPQSSKSLVGVQQYDFDQATQVWDLPKDLTEISGLTFDAWDNCLYTVADEKGVIYKIGLNDGKVAGKMNFGKSGDYEGLTSNEENIVVARSDGDLYWYDKKSKQTTHVKTLLSERNDVEGLCFLNNKHLLLACKGKSIGKSKDNNVKFVYQFSIKKQRVKEESFIEIEAADLVQTIRSQSNRINLIGSQKEIYRIADFAPSGIAIHPKTREIYILSARGSSLIVMNEAHDIMDVICLNEKDLPQPEGICFDTQGNMYLSTEGQQRNGRIYKYAAK